MLNRWTLEPARPACPRAPQPQEARDAARRAEPAEPRGAGAERASRPHCRRDDAGGERRRRGRRTAAAASNVGTGGQSRRRRRRAPPGRPTSWTTRPSGPGPESGRSCRGTAAVAAGPRRPAACSSAGPGWQQALGGRRGPGPRRLSPLQGAPAARVGKHRPPRGAQRRTRDTDFWTNRARTRVESLGPGLVEAAPEARGPRVGLGRESVDHDATPARVSRGPRHHQPKVVGYRGAADAVHVRTVAELRTLNGCVMRRRRPRRRG
jgi:hypothetical protein